MSGKQTVERATSILVAACAVVMVFLAATRGRPAGASTTREPEFIPGWEIEALRGIRIGPSDATYTVVEFVDFQCPACQRFAGRADSLLNYIPGLASLVVHHFPLKSHPHAVPAAIAAECADRQGRFSAMSSALFARQSEIGTRAWRLFAEDAVMPNLEEFERCRSLPQDSFPRIEYGRKLGERTGVRATPTVWLNGWRQPTLPTFEVMLAEAKAAQDKANADRIITLPGGKQIIKR